MLSATWETDARRLRSLAHGLKGSAASLAAESIRQTAFSLEQMVDNGNLTLVNENLAHLEKCLQELQDFVNISGGKARSAS